MRIKKTAEEMIEEDAKSVASSLGITVDDLKSTKVSLYDLIACKHNPELARMFSSARSVYALTIFYLVERLVATKGDKKHVG